MWKNYLKIALRTLLRRKGYSFINIAGLTLGLASCLVIFQYVAFEYSFDRFHDHEGDLYRVTQALAQPGEEFEPGPYTAYGLAPALTEAVPEVLHAARLHPEYSPAVVSSAGHPERAFEEEQVFYADPAFLEMFTFPLMAGSLDEALEPGTVLLSASAAKKYFGEKNPIGQVLDWTGEIEKSYRVAGVFQDTPANSHLQFDFLLPMEDLLRGETYSAADKAWSWNNFYTYVQLRSGADRAAAERKMTEVYTAHIPETFREQDLTARLSAQPLRDVHLNAAISTPEMFVTGSYRTVYFFTVIGLVTLIIALLNYVNLATARSLDRAREVGVRKVAGAYRGQLIRQFLFESALTNLIAAALAVLLTASLTPAVNALAGTQLTGALWTNPWFWAAFLATFGTGTLLAGLYPAFVLSSFKPASVLKGKAGSLASQLWLRRGLVVLQFAASVVLVAGTAIVYDQLHYMRGMDLGLDLEQVLTVQGPRVLPEGADRGAALNTFAEELRRLPNVRQTATSTTLPGQGFNWNGASVRQATDDPANAIRGVVTWIDTSFASLYGLELVAGDGFSDATVSEASAASDAEDAPLSLIANETAVKTLGFASPATAVGQSLVIGDIDARLIGVFQDFNWTSAHEKRENIFFGYTDEGRHISLRVSTEDLPGTIAAAERIYNARFPGNPFRYGFADEQFDQQYRQDQRFAQLFTVFAGLAVLIACLGLFGLASFTAQQRTKEIGVRKVLGASVPGIAALLSKDFLKLVLLAVVIASPAAYLLMSQWLEDFAYRIEIGPGIFLLTGGLILLIALLTVSYQAVRAATVDPVKSLRYE